MAAAKKISDCLLQVEWRRLVVDFVVVIFSTTLSMCKCKKKKELQFIFFIVAVVVVAATERNTCAIMQLIFLVFFLLLLGFLHCCRRSCLNQFLFLSAYEFSWVSRVIQPAGNG